MAPLLQDSNTPIHEEIFVEQTYHCNYEPERGIRTAGTCISTQRGNIPKPTRQLRPGLSKSEALEKRMDPTVDDVQLYDTSLTPMKL
jgi:hypothetical protein